MYSGPVYSGPLILCAVAVAIAADGRRSPEILRRYTVSLDPLEAQHSLQRQLEADAPPKSAAKPCHVSLS